MSLYVVAISGKLCSGKSTLAKSLQERMSPSQVMGFARPLKNDIETLTGCTINDENKGIFRPLLQKYGQAMRQLKGKDYWVDRWWDIIWEDVVMIDDARFPDELDNLEKMMVCTTGRLLKVRIHIDAQEQLYRHIERYGVEPDPAILVEESETSLDDYTDWDIQFNAKMPQELMTAEVLRACTHYEFPGAPAPVHANWYDGDDEV